MLLRDVLVGRACVLYLQMASSWPVEVLRGHSTIDALEHRLSERDLDWWVRLNSVWR